jgi:hypothetical protein
MDRTIEPLLLGHLPHSVPIGVRSTATSAYDRI